uniref:Centrosomal protein of 76 kDa n=1 Tax=Eutreptiella gymnastica TaxID=73025 RepID=A0A7S1J7S2_9EUGL
MSVELGGGSTGLKVPVGVLELQIELIPNPTSRTSVAEEDIIAQINAERTNKTAAEREFLVYARRWWEEYHNVSKDHANRIVKVFAQLTSATQVMLPVTSWVTPMIANRILDSPQQAARFVALLGYDADVGTASAVTQGGTAGSDSWMSTHAFLLKGQGHVCNHTILLCNLLLGFGLDAYVVIGRDENGPHMWVMTKTTEEVIFWESVTGARYVHVLDGRPPTYMYTHVGCVFNHTVFYGNIQASDHVRSCTFNLDDETCWKPMSTMKLKLCKKQPKVPIHPSTIDCLALEESLESSLLNFVKDHRDGMGLTCAWNAEFSYILAQALCSYEHEKCYGVVVDNRYFEAAVKANVRDGYTFKGYPMHFSHCSDRRIGKAFLQSRTCIDILETVGQLVTHCVRVKCFAYAENVVSVWVMLAVRYKGVAPS